MFCVRCSVNRCRPDSERLQPRPPSEGKRGKVTLAIDRLRDATDLLKPRAALRCSGATALPSGQPRTLSYDVAGRVVFQRFDEPSSRCGGSIRSYR
jgi:hypothetical protein